MNYEYINIFSYFCCHKSIYEQNSNDNKIEIAFNPYQNQNLISNPISNTINTCQY
jgi:hypothetical protein